jgi:hypothetical protein
MCAQAAVDGATQAVTSFSIARFVLLGIVRIAVLVTTVKCAGCTFACRAVRLRVVRSAEFFPAKDAEMWHSVILAWGRFVPHAEMSDIARLAKCLTATPVVTECKCERKPIFKRKAKN